MSEVKVKENESLDSALRRFKRTCARKYCDFVITIDADLQQDIEALDRFIKEYYAGNEIVFGVRNSRNTDSFFKKSTATIFYKLMHFLGCNIYENSACFGRMDYGNDIVFFVEKDGKEYNICTFDCDMFFCLCERKYYNFFLL